MDGTIRLTPTDARLLDAAPILCLVRLDRALPSAAVDAAFTRHLPRRLAAAVRDDGAGPVLRSEPGGMAFGTLDVGAGELDRLTGIGVPVADLAAIGLGDAPAREPVCTLTHLRAADGDALAIRLSHAAGDGVTLLGVLGRLLDELGAAPTEDRPTLRRPRAGTTAEPGIADENGTPAPTDPAGERTARHAGPPPSAVRAAPGIERHLSVLRLSPAGHDELAAVAATRPSLSPTVRHMAVVARRVSALVDPGGAELRIRIPVDLRFRDLGIPPSATGNHWFDALAVVGAVPAAAAGAAAAGSAEVPRAAAPVALPPAEEVADAVDAAIRQRLAVLRRDDVDHRPDESLRLRRDLAGEPIRPGTDVVFSSLPAPAWPGVRALHVLGLSPLGVVAVRGAGTVDVVTPRPPAAGVTAL